MPDLRLTAVPDVPLVEPGDDVASITVNALSVANMTLQDDDVLVFAQKVISKAENRYAYLNDVEPSQEAVDLAQRTRKDPRLVQLILQESKSVIRHGPGVIIVEHRCGYVHANAGIDRSNIDSNPDNPRVLLLPVDCNVSAEKLREGVRTQTGCSISVIINDSAGRAWRTGTVGMALGSAGFEPLESFVGEKDLFGNQMQVTEVAVADELAAAASYLMGQAAEGRPIVQARGATLRRGDSGAHRLLRDKSHDLFR